MEPNQPPQANNNPIFARPEGGLPPQVAAIIGQRFQPPVNPMTQTLINNMQLAINPDRPILVENPRPTNVPLSTSTLNLAIGRRL